MTTKNEKNDDLVLAFVFGLVLTAFLAVVLSKSMILVWVLGTPLVWLFILVMVMGLFFVFDLIKRYYKTSKRKKVEK